MAAILPAASRHSEGLRISAVEVLPGDPSAFTADTRARPAGPGVGAGTKDGTAGALAAGTAAATAAGTVEAGTVEAGTVAAGTRLGWAGAAATAIGAEPIAGGQRCLPETLYAAS